MSSCGFYFGLLALICDCRRLCAGCPLAEGSGGGSEMSEHGKEFGRPRLGINYSRKEIASANAN
jgi:hypothetical protein